MSIGTTTSGLPIERAVDGGSPLGSRVCRTSHRADHSTRRGGGPRCSPAAEAARQIKDTEARCEALISVADHQTLCGYTGDAVTTLRLAESLRQGCDQGTDGRLAEHRSEDPAWALLVAAEAGVDSTRVCGGRTTGPGDPGSQGAGVSSRSGAWGWSLLRVAVAGDLAGGCAGCLPPFPPKRQKRPRDTLHAWGTKARMTRISRH